MMLVRLSGYRSLNKGEVEELESELGVSLPSEYCKFVKEFDGAHLDENSVSGFEDIGVTQFVPVSEIAKLVKEVDGFPCEGIPIANTISGDLIYMKRVGFSIRYWNHEVEYDEDPEVAPSFLEFLELIAPVDRPPLKLKPGQVKSGLGDPDFKPIFD